MSTTEEQKTLILRAVEDYLLRKGFITRPNASKSYGFDVSVPEVSEKLRYWYPMGIGRLRRNELRICSKKLLLAEPDSLEQLAAGLKYCCSMPFYTDLDENTCDSCKFSAEKQRKVSKT